VAVLLVRDDYHHPPNLSLVKVRASALSVVVLRHLCRLLAVCDLHQYHRQLSELVLVSALLELVALRVQLHEHLFVHHLYQFLRSLCFGHAIDHLLELNQPLHCYLR
jgi:hypothetical protein